MLNVFVIGTGFCTKILVLVLLVASATCQQVGDKDDGSYSPEKYEKPYENLIDETGEQPSTFQNQIPGAFRGPQAIRPQANQPQRQSLFLQQPPNDPAQQSPFPQNVFFQRLQNAALQRQQNSIPQQIPQTSQQFGPLQPREQPVQPSFGRPASANQFSDEGSPLQSTNYQTDGHRRSEVVDDAGNVLGQYSYVDPNGKTITVRYSAGKDGFRVEGDHIPKAPQSPELGPLGLPQTSIPFRPQEARFDDPLPQQFFDPNGQPRSQSGSFRPQFAAPASGPLRQQSQYDAQDQFSFRPDGSYQVQSRFQ